VSLQSVAILRDWKAAKQNLKWYETMIEEMNALNKNKSLELMQLPAAKRAIGCKCI
jgi:hypothetical protein